MVSFQKLAELSDKKKSSETDLQEYSSDQTLPLPTKKIRRSSEDTTIRVQQFLDETRWTRSVHNSPSLLIDVDLHLRTSPLPPVPCRTHHPNTLWKQTQTGCNIRTVQKTTSSSSKDPISLDLGLNLQCSIKSSSIINNGFQDKGANNLSKHGDNYYTKNFHLAIGHRDQVKENAKDKVGAEEEEMVAKACMRCHMLVMMCKSCPSCPNCKFMHPLDHTTTLLLKPRPSNINNASSCVR